MESAAGEWDDRIEPWQFFDEGCPFRIYQPLDFQMRPGRSDEAGGGDGMDYVP